jgi:hypothetical protein
MTLAISLEEQAVALERDATALRKLSEAAQELGEERVRALLAPVLNSNGNGSPRRGTDQDEPVVDEDAPRGREAVRRIVRERPGIWTLREIRAEMQRRGWFTSNKGVEVAVMRLANNNEARRIGKGRYEFFVADETRLL